MFCEGAGSERGLYTKLAIRSSYFHCFSEPGPATTGISVPCLVYTAW